MTAVASNGAAGTTAVITALGTPATGVVAACHEAVNGNSWAVAVPLVASTVAAPSLWCVDSTGASQSGVALPGGISECP